MNTYVPQPSPPEPNYVHVRNIDYRYLLRGAENSNFQLPQSRGGLTIAYRLKIVQRPTGGPYVQVQAGWSRCHSSDVYKKSTGRRGAKLMLDTTPLELFLTNDVSLALPIDGSPDWVRIRERDYPVIENVIEKVKKTLSRPVASVTDEIKGDVTITLGARAAWPFPSNTTL